MPSGAELPANLRSLATRNAVRLIRCCTSRVIYSENAVMHLRMHGCRLPEGTVKGPTYEGNGNMVTELCRGVSGALDYVGRFCNDEELWRTQPSLETAAKFSARYTDTFGPGFEEYLARGWMTSLSSTAVGPDRTVVKRCRTAFRRRSAIVTRL